MVDKKLQSIYNHPIFNSQRGHFNIGMPLFFCLTFVMLSREKRRRLHSLLPLSAGDIGISRVLFVILFWIPFVIVFGLNLLMVRLDTVEVDHTTFKSNLLLDILAIQGLMIILNAKYHITRDIGFCIKRRFTILNISSDYVPGALLALLLAAVIGFLTFIQIGSIEPLRTIVLSTAVSPAGTFALNSFGIVLSYLSIVIFIRRRSYLA